MQNTKIKFSKKQLKQIAETKAIQKQWKRAEEKCIDMRKLELKAFKKVIPRLREDLKKSPKVNIGIWGDFLPEGIGGTEIDLVESAGQKIDFRVGPVFGKGGTYKEPGLWIGYQTRAWASSRQGDLLISPEIWRRLNKEIEARFKSFNAEGYGPGKVISVKKPKKGKK